MLYDIKKEIEDYFQDNWTLTDIQFEGQDFANPDKWISLVFVPIDRSANTCLRTNEIYQLKVMCYDVSPTLVNKLVDEVHAFADCTTLASCHIGAGDFDGLGVQPIGDGKYELVTIFKIDKIN